MISLAIGSSLMIAVTVKYVQARKKFTQWSPPKYNNSSANSGSQIGGGASTHSSSQRVSTAGQRGLYDRWLMVRFTIAFVLLAYVRPLAFSFFLLFCDLFCWPLFQSHISKLT